MLSVCVRFSPVVRCRRRAISISSVAKAVRREGGKSYEALVRGDWKILQNDPFSPLELYHLQDDPQESRNLARTQPEKLRELSQALQFHIQRAGAVPWQRR